VIWARTLSPARTLLQDFEMGFLHRNATKRDALTTYPAEDVSIIAHATLLCFSTVTTMQNYTHFHESLVPHLSSLRLHSVTYTCREGITSDGLISITRALQLPAIYVDSLKLRTSQQKSTKIAQRDRALARETQDRAQQSIRYRSHHVAQTPYLVILTGPPAQKYYIATQKNVTQ
jgi:hypothetical protein